HTFLLLPLPPLHQPPPLAPLFPYTTLFRSPAGALEVEFGPGVGLIHANLVLVVTRGGPCGEAHSDPRGDPEGSGHRRHGAGELHAVAALVAQEVLESGSGRLGGSIERVLELVAAEPVLQRHRGLTLVLGPGGELLRGSDYEIGY